MITAPRIKFRCPTCSRALRAPQRKEGSFGNCPGCAQRLQVPLSRSRNAGRHVELEATTPSRIGGILLRLFAWTVCVTWVSYLVWSRCNPLAFLGGNVPETAVLIATLVHIVGAYVATRAVDSLSRW